MIKPKLSKVLGREKPEPIPPKLRKGKAKKKRKAKREPVVTQEDLDSQPPVKRVPNGFMELSPQQISALKHPKLKSFMAKRRTDCNVMFAPEWQDKFTDEEWAFHYMYMVQKAMFRLTGAVGRARKEKDNKRLRNAEVMAQTLVAALFTLLPEDYENAERMHSEAQAYANKQNLRTFHHDREFNRSNEHVDHSKW